MGGDGGGQLGDGVGGDGPGERGVWGGDVGDVARMRGDGDRLALDSAMVEGREESGGRVERTGREEKGMRGVVRRVDGVGGACREVGW